MSSDRPAIDYSNSNSDSIFTFLKLSNSSPSLTGVQLLSQAAISNLINTSVFPFFRSSCLSTALVPFNITFQSRELCTLKELKIPPNNFNAPFQECSDFYIDISSNDGMLGGIWSAIISRYIPPTVNVLPKYWE